MIKKMTTVLVAGLLGTSLYAGNYDSNTKGFIGLEVGAATVDGSKQDGFKHQGSGVEYGLRLGAQNDEWRATFLGTYFDAGSDDQSVQKALGMVDYFFFTSDSDMKVRPFIGANLGYGRYESTFVDVTGLTYGGQAGVVVGLGENIDLDLSYRYILFESESVNSAGNIVFGLNYLY